MKIIGNDGKEYFGDTIEEAIEKAKKADEELKKSEEQAKKQAEDSAKALSKQKKALCDKIDLTEVVLDKAYEDYDNAVKEVRKLNAEHDKKVQEILQHARSGIEQAHKEHVEAVREFNDKFGVYHKVYTDEQAKKSLHLWDIDPLSEFFEHFWRW